METALERTAGGYAVGPNPHYKPPVMRWNRVEIEAKAGYSFAIVMDSGGALVIRVCCPHDAFVERNLPPHTAVETLEGDHSVWCVINDERLSAVGHEFQPNPDNPEDCLLCQPVDAETTLDQA